MYKYCYSNIRPKVYAFPSGLFSAIFSYRFLFVCLADHKQYVSNVVKCESGVDYE